jgi:hypothetical protein
VGWELEADRLTDFYISLSIGAPFFLVGGLLAGGEYLFSKEKERDKRTWDLRVSDTDE